MNYLRYSEPKVQLGTRFIPVNRRTGHYAMHGGVCTAVRGDKGLVINRGKNGDWISVNAIDEDGNERSFIREAGWGFIRTWR